MAKLDKRYSGRQIR